MRVSKVLLAAALAASPVAGAQQPAAPAAQQQAPAADAPLASAAVPAATRTLTLQEVLERAEAQSNDLKALRARLRQAQTTSAKAWSGYLPQVNVGASYTRNSDAAEIPFATGYIVRRGLAPDTGAGIPGDPIDVSPAPGVQAPEGETTDLSVLPNYGGRDPVTIQARDQLGAQVEARQTLLSPALIQAIRNAGKVEAVAEANVENGRRDLLFGVAQLYLGTAGLKEAVAVQERLLEVNRAREKDAQVRYDAGALPKVALLRAQIDRARSEQDVVRARNAYLGSRHQLATLLDEPADFDVTVPQEPALPQDLSPETLEKDALSLRPDLLGARKSLELARGQKAGVWWRYFPNIGLSGVYRVANVGGFTGSSDSWAITLGAQWAILDGGLREAELREAGARVAEAEATQRAAELRARDEVRRNLLELESARANRVKAQEQLSLARENQRLVDVNFRAGAATYVEVADANAALANAETGFVGETINASIAALRVLRTVGRFGAEAPAKVEYTPAPAAPPVTTAPGGPSPRQNQ